MLGHFINDPEFSLLMHEILPGMVTVQLQWVLKFWNITQGFAIFYYSFRVRNRALGFLFPWLLLGAKEIVVSTNLKGCSCHHLRLPVIFSFF